MYRQIYNLIVKYISYIYSEKSILIEEIVEKEYNKIMKEMPETVEASPNSFETYKVTLKEAFTISNKISNDIMIYDSKLKHINNTINELENTKITYNISVINALVDMKINQVFCLGTYINYICPDKNITKPIIYNYQIAKIRSSINDFTNVLQYSDYLINENNLNSFYINEYYNEFNENVNFNFNRFLNRIIDYLTNIREREEKLIHPFLISIKDILKNAFNSNINYDKIIATFEYFCQKSFYIPKKYNIERTDYTWLLENKIKEIFVKKIEDYMNYERLYGFFFNESQFTIVYDQFYNKIIKMFDDTYKNISNSLNLNDEIINYIINYQGKIIEDGLDVIKQYLKNISEISPTIELLNNSFSVSEINISEIDDLYNNIKLNYANQFKSISSDKFNSLILNDVLTLLNDSQKILLERLEDEKVIMETYLKTHSRTLITHNQTKLIDNMTDYENKLIEAFQDFYNQFYQLFSNNNIKEFLFEIIKNNITTLDFEFSFDDLTNELTIALGSIIDSVSMMYNTERREFSEKIYDFIEESFKEGIKTYIETFGLNYYDAVVDQDFFNNIYPDLFYIHQVIYDTKEYTSLLFNASNFTEISELIKETLSTIYIESKEIIKNNTENKVDQIVYNLLDGKTETLRDLIIEGFNENITEQFNSEELKNYLNDKIIALLPKNFSNYFKEKLKNYYMELSNEIILVEIKNNFKVLLNEELTIVYNYLDETQQFTNNLLERYETFKIDESMKNILNIYNDYSSNIQNYKYLSINEESYNNIKDIIHQLVIEIANNLKTVSNKYFVKLEEAKDKIGNLINKNLDFVNKFKELLDPETKVNNTIYAYEKIISITEIIKDYSVNIFTDFNNEIDNVTEEERENKMNELDLRRLIELKNYYIDGFLEKLEKTYYSYGQTISGLEEYINLSSSNYLFLSKMKDEISSASNYISSTYLYLKYIYPDEKLEEYFSNIENKEEEIQIIAYQFLRNESFIIDKTLKLIKKDIFKLYPSIEEGLKNDIINTLNLRIPELMRQLETIEKKNSSKLENITINPELDTNNYILKSNSIGYISGNYSTKYSFDIDVDEGLIIFNSSVNSMVLGNFSNIFDIVEEKIDGIFGNSEIGLNLNFSIYDEKLYQEFYVVQKRDYENYLYKFADKITKNSTLFGDLNLTKSLKDYYSRTQKDL